MHLIYKQFHLYINLCIKKQHVLLLRNYNFYSVYTFQLKSSFNLKSINEEFLLFLKLLKKHAV